jgi:hypothetical protein
VKNELTAQFLSLRRILVSERDQLTNRLKSITDALAGGEIPIPAAVTLFPTAVRRKGGMSAAGRARVAAAQRARWAKLKAMKGTVAGGKVPTPSKTAGPVAKAAMRRKPGMSAAGRARIAAAQRARWAKLKAGKK